MLVESVVELTSKPPYPKCNLSPLLASQSWPYTINTSHYCRIVDLLRPRASSPELGLKLEVAPSLTRHDTTTCSIRKMSRNSSAR